MKKHQWFTMLLVLSFLFQSIMTPCNVEGKNADKSIPLLTLSYLTTTENAVELIWTSSDNRVKATKYEIYRNETIVKTTASFTYLDKGLTSNTEYMYLIKAKDAEGKVVAESNRLHVVTLADKILTSEVSLNLVASEIKDTSVKLVWDKIDGIKDELTYVVLDDQKTIARTTDTAYVIENLAPDTEYTFSVIASEATDNSSVSGSSISVISISDNCIAVKTLGLNADEMSSNDNSIEVNGNPDFETDRFIVKYKNGNGNRKLEEAFEGRVNRTKRIRNNTRNNETEENVFVVKMDKKVKVMEFVDEIEKNKLSNDVEYIQPDYDLNLSSNDPYYALQWGLKNNNSEIQNTVSVTLEEAIGMLHPFLREAIDENIEFKEFLYSTPWLEIKERIMAGDVPGDVKPDILMELANEPVFMDMKNQEVSQTQDLGRQSIEEEWRSVSGSAVTIGLIDTGVDIAHEDLADNIWTNQGEIAGNGVDDDGNGKIDDINGWNFCDDSNVVYDAVNMTEENHGTSLAGIISAVEDNGKGIAGVAPFTKIMPLKVFENGHAYTSDIIEAIQYAESMGIKILNCSWGSTADNPALKEAIQNTDMFFVCAAGNSSSDLDSSPVYPAAFDCDNIISVASVNKSGTLSSFSNYGVNGVDVAAPGEEIISTLPDNNYGEESGTSMASAFVSGEAAILLSLNNNMSSIELKDRITSCSDHLSGLTGKIAGGNKINFNNTISGATNNEMISVSEADAIRSVNAVTESGSNEFELLSSVTEMGQYVKIAAGGTHSLALKNDGTVWQSGYDYYSYEESMWTAPLFSAAKVNNLSKITTVAAGKYHSLALKIDGTVWSWGDNSYGQLGNGQKVPSSIVVQVSGLSGITAITAGDYHNLALKSDGTVWSWGQNSYGQLGNGTTTSSTTPVTVSGLSGITAIAAGSSHSLALKSDGTVWAWGYNYSGELGNGTTTVSITPVQVRGLSGIIAITAGGYHNLVLKNDGTVWAWGQNSYGELGNGTTTQSITPVQVGGLSGITALAAGSRHSLAIKNDGTVWAWGCNNYGQLGDETVTQRNTPVQVIGLSDITEIAAGEFHSLTLKKGAVIESFGDNYYGQLGDGSEIQTYRSTSVYMLSGITALAAGSCHNLALKNDGTVWAWGKNDSGQLGDGTTIQRSKPVQVIGLSGIKAIAAGSAHSLALKNDGTVWAWGDNFGAQLGDGTKTRRTTAVQVYGLTGVITIAAGGYNSMALKSNGSVWSWGDYYVTTPACVISGGIGSKIVQIACGSSHYLASKQDGTVWAWGSNNYGQLGDGTTVGEAMPVQVSGLAGVTRIAAGNGHSLALKNDGTVWAWGNNCYGQLGDGTTLQSDTPVQVSELSGIIDIDASDCHSIALKNNHEEWSWGRSNYYAMGSVKPFYSIYPENIMSNNKSIAAGDYHSLGLKDNGTVWAQGFNYYGQLGNVQEGYSTRAHLSFGTIEYIPQTCVVNCTAGKAFDLVFNIQNIQDFNSRVFVITYKAEDISRILDLCKMTYTKETSSGKIKGTGITILLDGGGVVKFKVDKSIASGQAWSGTVNIITFVSAITGQITLTCEVK